jgi:hypothetical protein
VRRFRIEGCDFFGLVENLQRTVEKDMDIDSPVSVRTKGRGLGDLQYGPFKGDRVVLGHGSLLLETQRLLDLQ